MGLAIEVGVLADLLVHDSEGAERVQSDFSQLNEALAQANLPAHREPTDCEVWDGEMCGYSGLHYLRRLAAHLDATDQLPSPGDQNSSKDPLLADYFRSYTGERRGLLSRWRKKPPTFARRFDHLIIHSDAGGYYIPQDFHPETSLVARALAFRINSARAPQPWS